MHHSIIIAFFALSMVGCRHALQTANDAALQMWRSPRSSLQQRADAVNKLIPQGTRIEDVERVLGRKGTWTRFRGPMPTTTSIIDDFQIMITGGLFTSFPVEV